MPSTTPRGVALGVLTLTLALTITACGGDGGDGKGDATTVSAKLPHHMPPDSLDDKCIHEFADAAADDAGVEFEITPAGALGGEADVEQNLFEGVFEATLMSTVMMGVWEDSAQVLNLPYVIPDIDTGREVLNSDLMQPTYDKLLADKDARILGWCHWSMRETAAGKPIREPADLKGLKIRVPETDAFVKTFSSLGANPTALGQPEVYNALKTGIVDAAESNFYDMLQFKYNEVAPYFSRTSHIFVAQAIVVNDTWFQELTKDQQDGLIDAARKAEEDTFPKRHALDEDVTTQLEEAGVTVVDDVDTDAFDQAVTSVRAELAEQYGVEDLLSRIQSEIG